MTENNQIDKPWEDIQDETENIRVGNRIRKIRSEQRLSQTQLGELVGLNANRIQQYENGVRKPKLELTKKIASALGVSPLAILDPVTNHDVGMMYALFETEERLELELEVHDNCISIHFGKNNPGFRLQPLFEYLKKWDELRSNKNEALAVALTEEDRQQILHDYQMSEWNFPDQISVDSDVQMKRKRLEMQIENLQKELEQLEEIDLLCQKKSF